MPAPDNRAIEPNRQFAPTDASVVPKRVTTEIPVSVVEDSDKETIGR